MREVGADTFVAWTRGAAILFPNEEEAAILAGSSEPETQCARLAKHYPLVVIKRGAAGAEAAEGERRWCVNAPKIEAVDTTGAGDAFVAGFLAARIEGAEIDAALTRAVVAGSEAAVKVGEGRGPHARLPSTGRVGVSAACVSASFIWPPGYAATAIRVCWRFLDHFSRLDKEGVPRMRSVLAHALSAFILATAAIPAGAAIVSMTGANGMDGADADPGQNGGPGDPSTTADAGHSPTNTDIVNRATATGGNGGVGGDSTGFGNAGSGGAGGAATAYAATNASEQRPRSDRDCQRRRWRRWRPGQ